MKRHFSVMVLAMVLAGGLLLVMSAPVDSLSWQQQLEADWLRQDAKRLAPSSANPNVTANEDAAGGVDGIKNGQWGFHTQHEKNPWWQVDLQQTVKLQRVVVFNRCESGMAPRASQLQVLTSLDGQSFKLVYTHNGTVFYGFTDQKPLVIQLDGVETRFLRLALPTISYFHLDEVEVYPVGDSRNLALGKSATQSSTSEWSAPSPAAVQSAPTSLPTRLVIQRGLKLAQSQHQLGAPVAPYEKTLRQLADELKQLPAEATPEQQRELYFRAQATVRQMALANPLLNFEDLLFVKRAPGMFPHMSDQHYGWWSRPGGGVYVLKNFKAQVARPEITASGPEPVCLTADMPAGSYTGPDLSYDGQKVLFAYCRYHPEVADREKVNKDQLPADVFYHLYEMNVDGTKRRQLTQGRYDDFDARYLPSGEIMFLSTRKGLAIQGSKEFSDSTRQTDRLDSYVRCGGDSRRPVPIFTLHVMDANGHNIRPLSAFENFEWTPSVAHDGRVLYTRWDYIDRFNGHFFSLWSANQDGANPQLVYGNYTVKPQVVLEARSIPGSTKLVFTACAHHSITGGSLCLLDRTQGTEDEAPLTRLTPEVCFPETEGWPEHYYANPWPLSEEYFLVAWAAAKLPPHTRVEDQRNPVNAMGLYLYDAFGNLELLYRDPDLTSMYPIPIAPRDRPPIQSPVADWNGAPHGQMLVQDVYLGLEGVRRGSIKRLRLVGVPPKVQPYMNNPVLGVSAEDPGKFVLGTVPVEPDGSAYFALPSGVPVFVQALDEQGLALQTMRSLTYVMPNQTLSCIGCHEHRDTAPPMSAFPLAARREPSKLTPGPEGAWPLRFTDLVQPVLNRYCVACHRPDSEDPAARAMDLTGDKAYSTLLSFGNEDLKKAAFERDRSIAGRGVCATSKLWALLTGAPGHQGVQLDQDSRNRLTTWMDTYAQRLGSFSAEQEKQLAELRLSLQPILAEPPENQ